MQCEAYGCNPDFDMNTCPLCGFSKDEDFSSFEFLNNPDIKDILEDVKSEVRDILPSFCQICFSGLK